MTETRLPNVLDPVGARMGDAQVRSLPDQQLLARFVRHHEEEAFAVLLERHGAMVLGVCGRILRNPHDAEDACQAVFLVLARRAGSVRKRGSLGSWLHGVAWRIARKLRASLARRIVRETGAASTRPTLSEPPDLTLREALRVLDEELNRLPHRYRAPLVLCHLEGRTQDEAATELGWSPGTLRGRLQRGRERLRSRLLRRGMTASAAVAAISLTPGLCSAAVPSPLVASTLDASVALARGLPLPAATREQALALAQEALRSQMVNKLLLGLVWCLITVAIGAGALWAAPLLRRSPTPAAEEPRTVEHWGNPLRLEHELRAWCVAFSPDGKKVVSGAGGLFPSRGEIKFWDAITGKELVRHATPQSVRGVVFAPDGKTLATAEHDGLARLRHADTGEVLVTFRGHRAGIDNVAFSPDGKTLATSSWDGTVKLWETASGKEIRTLSGRAGQLFAVAHGAGEGTVASGGVDRTARIWDAATGDVRFTLTGHRNVVHWLAYSPDGRTLATASWDRTVKLWSTGTGKLLATLRGHADPVLALTFSPDGRSLASCGGKWPGGNTPASTPSPGEVIIWDLDTYALRSRVVGLADRVFGVAYAPDGNTLGVACWDGSVQLWKRQMVAAAVEPEPEKKPRPQPSPDRQLPLKGTPENFAELELIGPNAARCVRFEPDGLRIKLPVGFPRERPNTGVRIPASAVGDFEVTVNYEILSEPAPAEVGKRPTKIALQTVLEREKWTVAVITRRVANKGLQFTTWTIRDDHEGSGKRQTKYREFPAQTKVGRFRIVRSGTEISFQVAEGPGAAFTLLQTFPAHQEDLQSVELIGSTGDPKSALDVRFTDLRIRTGVVPVLVEDAAVPRSSWKLLLVLAIVLGLAVPVVRLLLLRRRRDDPATQAISDLADTAERPAKAPAIPFECPGCGRVMKVRAELAGKKGKCPGCGGAIRVPESGAGGSPA